MNKELFKGIVLKRKVDIEIWRIKGIVSRAERRPEYMPILHQLSDSGPCTDSDIAEHLLFSGEGRKTVARRMLDTVACLGLSERTSVGYSLTEAGEDALRENRVFIPQAGMWEVWVSDDPLLPFKIIKLEPYEEPKAYRDKPHERKINAIPPKVRCLLNGAAGIPCVGGKEVRIDSFEGKAEKINSNIDIRLEWNILKNRLQLKEDKQLYPLAAPEVEDDVLWMDLLACCGLKEFWDEESESVHRRFQDVMDEKNRVSMKETFSINKPQVSDFGLFEKISLRDVSISAATQEDAQQWVVWRLMNGINQLMSSKRYEELCASASRPFKQYSVEFPERDKLAKMLWEKKKDNRSWWVMAAADWAL
ncbi:hypothetical protein SAMN05660337_3493 [Maridesulfovibrio ferrireducens]|uniref:Uncharacterized protein n=1 Tax=Maridesulfovibrio ferrireducens TaxID=246191 RepID=A0A1G9LS53_9BACT|nr:hypothetical protein [Maridesulfovibrio ferrireducens]SDL64604.1 hypothetical protein SAMN05660337_3493 [Maridesulfovibrio ferrireducens]